MRVEREGGGYNKFEIYNCRLGNYLRGGGVLKFKFEQARYEITHPDTLFLHWARSRSED